MDRSRSIAKSIALGVALSLFGDSVILYNELKNDFMGRQEPDSGGIDCEFAGIIPLASTSVEQCHNVFQKPGLTRLMTFSSHQQSNVDKCATVLKT